MGRFDESNKREAETSTATPLSQSNGEQAAGEGRLPGRKTKGPAGDRRQPGRKAKGPDGEKAPRTRGGKPGFRTGAKPEGRREFKPGAKFGAKPGGKFGGKPVGKAGEPVGMPVPRPAGSPAPAAKPAPKRVFGRPTGGPGARPEGRSGPRPAGKPPLSRPGGRPLARTPGGPARSTPAAGLPTAKPLDPLAAAKAAWQPALTWCQKELRDARLMDPQVQAAVKELQSLVQGVMATPDAEAFALAQSRAARYAGEHTFLRWAPLPKV